MRRTRFLLRLPLFAAAVAGRLCGAALQLECTAGAHPQAERKADVTPLDGLLLDFDVSPAANWNIRRVTLLVHAASGGAKRIRIARVEEEWSESSPPEKPKLSAFKEYRASAQSGGWIGIELDPGVLAAPFRGIAVRGAGGVLVHSRHTLQHPPYLAVEGEPQR